MAEEGDEFGRRLVDWMTANIGIPESVLRARDTCDDWSFIIMMHAVLESALNRFRS